MKRLLLAALLVAVVAGGLAQPVDASTSQQTVSYVVRPNDTLSSIARQFCTTWQQIYALNRAVIGPNPNVLRSGTVLMVPNQCGAPPPQPPPPGPCNLGPIPHAMGPLNGNVYTVVWGDTLFSIARRFCTTVEQLAASNGIPHPWRIYAGQRLVVPVAPPQPTPLPPQPTPQPPQPTPPPPQQRYLTMTFPTAGAVLPITWTATGTGAGLFEGNVVVTAYTNAGVQLDQRATTLQGSNVGAGGPGTWSVALTTNVAPGTQGYVVASSPQSNVPDVRVAVTYGQNAGVPFIAITNPVANATLQPTFNVSGVGSNLGQGAVVVHARNSVGTVLAQAAVTVPGGSGQWSVVLTVNAAPDTPGVIFVFWQPNPNIASSVPVRFGGAAPPQDYYTFVPGQCQIQGIPGAPLYAFPGGPQRTVFDSSGLNYGALAGARLNGQLWYEIMVGSERLWAPIASIANTFGSCTW